ncbi:hypothetical protein GN956_G3844 [Arapaima gigas]
MDSSHRCVQNCNSHVFSFAILVINSILSRMWRVCLDFITSRMKREERKRKMWTRGHYTMALLLSRMGGSPHVSAHSTVGEHFTYLLKDVSSHANAPAASSAQTTEQHRIPA